MRALIPLSILGLIGAAAIGSSAACVVSASIPTTGVLPDGTAITFGTTACVGTVYFDYLGGYAACMDGFWAYEPAGWVAPGDYVICAGACDGSSSGGSGGSGGSAGSGGDGGGSGSEAGGSGGDGGGTSGGDGGGSTGTSGGGDGGGTSGGSSGGSGGG